MDKQSRRQVVRDYKERQVTPGIFAVRCPASGEIWVGVSRNLEQQQNGIWFGLRQGNYRNPAARAAWRAHGEAAFVFEVLETFDDPEAAPYVQASWLKDRERHWREALSAPKLVG